MKFDYKIDRQGQLSVFGFSKYKQEIIKSKITKTNIKCEIINPVESIIEAHLGSEINFFV